MLFRAALAEGWFATVVGDFIIFLRTLYKIFTVFCQLFELFFLLFVFFTYFSELLFQLKSNPLFLLSFLFCAELWFYLLLLPLLFLLLKLKSNA